jgi:type IV pilus assembly protein PilX
VSQMLHVTRGKQQGLVLVTSLLMLVVVTLLAVALFRSFGTDEKIAGNTREKHRALNAAETSEQAAEAWLAAGNGLAAVACATPALVYPASQICTQTMQQQSLDPTVLPWTMGVKYTAPTMVTGSTGAGTYISPPQYYIAFLGSHSVSNFTTSYYQIDAVGYGANANAAAVVEATYTTTASIKPLSGP